MTETNFENALKALEACTNPLTAVEKSVETAHTATSETHPGQKGGFGNRFKAAVVKIGNAALGTQKKSKTKRAIAKQLKALKVRMDEIQEMLTEMQGTIDQTNVKQNGEGVDTVVDATATAAGGPRGRQMKRHLRRMETKPIVED